MAWFLVVSPELSTTDDLREQTASVQTQNTVQQAKVAGLQNDFQDLNGLVATLGRVREGLPTGTGLPDLTRQLTAQAAAAKVSLTSITTAAPLLAGSPENPAAAAAAATTTPEAPAGEPATTGAESTTPAPAAQLLAIPVTVVVQGELKGHRTFLNALQIDGPRRALVSSVVLAPADGSAGASIDATTTMTLQLQVFVAPPTK